MNAHYLLALILVGVALAGCASPSNPDLSELNFQAPSEGTQIAASDLTWPDFTGQTLTILDHGAFPAFEDAAAQFSELTGATVLQESAGDAGSAVNQAILAKGNPSADIIYGIDQAYLVPALEAGILEPYQAQLSYRIPEEHLFATDFPGIVTPVDVGYIALNIDPANFEFANDQEEDGFNLFTLRSNAEDFVTQDPNRSSPGLGFLLITIGNFPETQSYDWKDYWRELLEGGAFVVDSWSTAYENYYTGGYGIFEDSHIGGYPIVTSYTESPAYEWYYDEVYPRETGEYEPGFHYQSNESLIPRVPLEHREKPMVWKQVQTMAILKGTPNLALAQAWIEYTLTDDFQAFAAPYNAVYPVVSSVSTDAIYGDIDPEPGTFDVVDIPFSQLQGNLERWLREWDALCKDYDCIS